MFLLMGRTTGKGFGDLLQSAVPDSSHLDCKLSCRSGCEQFQILAGGSYNHRVAHDGIAMLLCSIERACCGIDEYSAGLELAFLVDHHQESVLCQRFGFDELDPIATDGLLADVKYILVGIARYNRIIYRRILL